MMKRVCLSLFLLGSCHAHEVWILRECRTTNGEVFEYQQSSYEPQAEEHHHLINRHGVRDVRGWWHHEDTILTCRDKQ